MLVPMRAILDAADKNGYAQGAFNVNAVCQVKAGPQQSSFPVSSIASRR